jgi:mRNA interferase MazF
MNRPIRLPRQADIVLLDFPGVEKTKRRPALVVSSTLYQSTRPDVMVSLITTQIDAATSVTDHLLADWRQVGLNKPSAYRTFVVTIPRSAIVRTIGRLSERDWRAVRECLSAAFGLT